MYFWSYSFQSADVLNLFFLAHRKMIYFKIIGSYSSGDFKSFYEHQDLPKVLER